MQSTKILIDAFNSYTQKHKIPFATLRISQDHTKSKTVRDMNPDGDDILNDSGLMVEALWKDCWVYAASPRLNEDGVQSALDQAIKLAETYSKYPHLKLFNFDRNLRGKKSLKYKSQVTDSTIPSDGEIWDMLKQTCSILKNDDSRIVKVSAGIEVKTVHETWATTDGVVIEQDFNYLFADAEASALGKNNKVQRRSFGGLRGVSRQGGFEHWHSAVTKDSLTRVREQAIELSEAASCADTIMDMILMPDEMMIQIHESIGHPLELDRILGDERNYAGGSFVKEKDFGQLQYGSNLLNVAFDPTIVDEMASYGADHVGMPAEKVMLIENGKLLKGLGGYESQRRTDIAGCANQRSSSWNRPPIDRMANLNVLPGKTSYEDMIANTELGILMETNVSWSIDDFRNKFQFTCEYARMIRNGQLAEVVKNAGYRGVTVPFWNSLSAVGNEDTFQVFGTPFCGKGEPNQVIRVGHASPMCKFDKISVFGGEG